MSALSLPRRPRDVIATLGAVAIAAWGLLWAYAIVEGRLRIRSLWFGPWGFLGFDLSGSCKAAHHWLGGGNPYTELFGDPRGLYAYPPAALALHAWCGPLPPDLTVALWTIAFAACIALATRRCLDFRAAAGLAPLPYAAALAAVLFSTPVLFAVERGNADAWILLALVGASAALAERSLRRDLVAGALLGVAAWVKIFPGVTAFALLGLRRPRAFAAALGTMVLVAVLPWPATAAFFHNTVTAQHDRSAPLRDALTWLAHPVLGATGPYTIDRYFGHSLTSLWPALFGATPLGRVPGLVGSALLLGPLGLFVALRVARAAAPGRLALPFLLWATALGTFAQPDSFDYNLFFLVLAILATWDRRDRPTVHVLLGASLLCWQPFRIPIGAALHLVLKVLALAGAGLSLAARARETRAPAPDAH